MMSLDDVRWHYTKRYCDARYGADGDSERRLALRAIMMIGRLIGDWPEEM
jgi:hypothetical protein